MFNKVNMLKPIAIMVSLIALIAISLPGRSMASDEPVVSVSYDCNTNGIEGTVDITGCRFTEYSGYYRHRNGELITEASQMDIRTEVSGTVITLYVSGLLDFEDWKVKVEYDYKWSETSASGEGNPVTITRSISREHIFSGTTDKDDTVHDGYELAEKIRKYPSVKLAYDIVVKDKDGSVSVDGNTSGWKSTDEHFDKTVVDASGYSIISPQSLFTINGGACLSLKNASVIKGGGTAISVIDGKAEIYECNISGDGCGIFIDRKGVLAFDGGSIESTNGGCIESRSENEITIRNARLKGETGIDNNGKGLRKIASKVIVMPSSSGGKAYVNSSLVDTGVGRLTLKDSSISALGYAIKNTGSIVINGSLDTKSKTGLYNMGSAIFEGGNITIDASETGVVNGSWFHIIMDVIKEKDPSLSYKERYDIAMDLKDDMCAYANGDSYVGIEGSGECHITGDSTGISNSGTLIIDCTGSYITSEGTCIDNSGYTRLTGGHISGASCGIHNTGKLSQSGGSITGNSIYGVLQKGIYAMNSYASVESDNVIHLSKDHIINVTGSLHKKDCGVISIDSTDIYPGRTVIDASGLAESEADVLAGDSPNGVISKDGRFKLAFEYVNGHTAVLRSGKGDGYNGSKGTVILSALYKARYLHGMDTPLNDMHFKVPEPTMYFWNEPATFHTGSDINPESRVRILYGQRDISATFRQLGWKDEERIYHKKDQVLVLDDDHSFTALWDLACDIRFHGNNDTYEDGRRTEGRKDYGASRISFGYRLPGNSGDHFIRCELKCEADSSYMQRYGFNGWSLAPADPSDDLRYEPGYELKDHSLLYEALKIDNISYERSDDDGYRAVIHLYAVWDACPRLNANDIYIYDRELSDSKKLKKTVLREAGIAALDLEDGILGKSSITISTDPVSGKFDADLLMNRGNLGAIPLYYSASDSIGNRTVFMGNAFIITGDDEDRYYEGKPAYSAALNLSGTSPLSEDSTPVYIRYIDKEYPDTVEQRSIWRRKQYSSLLEKAFEGEAEESYRYDHTKIADLRKKIKEKKTGMNDDELLKILGYSKNVTESNASGLRLETKSGLSSVEVLWESNKNADTARITYDGDDGGVIDVPARECSKVITGLTPERRYSITVELLKDSVRIAKGKIAATTCSLSSPDIRTEVYEENGQGIAKVFFTKQENAAYYELQKQKLTPNGYLGWAMVASIDAASVSDTGLGSDLYHNEACYRDRLNPGIYRYRIRAVGYSLGDEDVRMTYQSNYTVSRETGFAPEPKMTGLTGGTDSILVKWKKVKDVDGYRVYYSYDDKEPLYEDYDNGCDMALLTRNINGGKKYKVSVCSLVRGERVYLSNMNSGVVKPVLLEEPDITISVKEKGVCISFPACSGADHYRIERRKLPLANASACESFDTEKTKVYFDLKPGVYEYRVTAVGERLDGKQIIKTGKWSMG